jgi:hypothetical protein
MYPLRGVTTLHPKCLQTSPFWKTFKKWIVSIICRCDVTTNDMRISSVFVANQKWDIMLIDIIICNTDVIITHSISCFDFIIYSKQIINHNYIRVCSDMYDDHELMGMISHSFTVRGLKLAHRIMRVARTISNIDKHSRLRSEVICFASKKDSLPVDWSTL